MVDLFVLKLAAAFIETGANIIAATGSTVIHRFAFWLIDTGLHLYTLAEKMHNRRKNVL